jgi:hypothetical protein
MACNQKYDLNWSKAVFYRFLAIHGRGWQILNVLSNWADNQIVWLIATGDPLWPVLRSMVHTVDNWLESPLRAVPEAPPIEFTTRLYSELLHLYRQKLPESAFKLLTEGIKRIELNSQAFRGPDGYFPDGPV